MKKVVILIIILSILGSASYFGYNYYIDSIKKEQPKNDPIKDTPEEEVLKDDNPIIPGLYKYYGSGQNRILQTEYTAPWTYHTDISSFEVFFTHNEEIGGSNFQKTFESYYTTYENIDNYKIGYIIKFYIGDKEVEKTILSPKDTEEYYDYLELYLYDDYHRTPGVWYSHTTESEMNDDTLLTSIKLTSGKNIDAITSDITLTVFTYDGDDVDELNNYTGESKYTITVKKAI